MAVATIASQQAITAARWLRPAAMIGLFREGLSQVGLPQILMIRVPATLSASSRRRSSRCSSARTCGRPGYQTRPAAGKVPAPVSGTARAPLKPSAKISAYVFLVGVALVVLFGFFPELRKLPGAKDALGMPVVIEIVMLSVAAIMLLLTKVNVDDVPKTATLRAGVVAVIGIFGLAWLGDSFIAAHKDVIVPAIGDMTKAAPWTFALGLFFASVLLYSQAETTRALMPLGMALGIPPQFLIAMFPSVNGYFFILTTAR